MLPLLPKNRFSPISVYRDAKSARRVISKEKPDIVIINTPLPDDFGTSLALDVSETDGVCVLLFTRAENFSELSSVLAPHGVLTLPKPTSPELTDVGADLMDFSGKGHGMTPVFSPRGARGRRERSPAEIRCFRAAEAEAFPAPEGRSLERLGAGDDARDRRMAALLAYDGVHRVLGALRGALAAL